MSESKGSVEDMIKAVQISGPSGVGKDYSTQAAVKALGLHNVQMTTDRPHRGAEETKNCIPGDEYSELQKAGLLVGDHVNKGNRYGYSIPHLKALPADSQVIMELNPAYQADVPEALRDHGIESAGWLGLVADDDYLVMNMKNRQPDMSDRELKDRLGMAHEIMDALESLSKEGKVTLYRVGMHNRERVAEEVPQMFAKMLGREK